MTSFLNDVFYNIDNKYHSSVLPKAEATNSIPRATVYVP